MPELALTRDNGWHQLDVLYVAGVMLLPRNAARRSILDSAFVGEEFVAAMSRGDLNPTGPEAAQFVEAIRLLPQVKRTRAGVELPADLHAPLRHGTVSGALLIAALTLADAQEPVRKAAAIERAEPMLGLLRRRSDGVGESDETIKKIWKIFRPVAHLWAAYLMLMRESPSLYVPCDLARMDSFLATAEALRRRGEAVRWSQSKEAVLDVAATWKVPAGAGKVG